MGFVRWLLVVLVMVGVFPACERGDAPRDWAARRGLESGTPPPDRPASVPADDAPHAAATKPGQDRFWIGLTTAVVGVTGIGVALGVWALEARRRLRAAGDALRTAILEGLRREGFDAVDVRLAPIPLFGGELTMELAGSVMSESDRQRASAIARDEARRGPMDARLVDRLAVAATRRAAG